MRITLSRLLLAALMFVLVIIGEDLTLRSYSLYAICSALIVYCFVDMITGENKMFFNVELLILFLFFVYSGISYFWALDRTQVLYRTKVLFFMTVLVLLVTNIYTWEGECGVFIDFYWMMSLLISILCIMRFGFSGIRNMIVSGVRLGRHHFMGKNANTIGMDCASAGIISLYYAFFKNRKTALWALAPILPIVIATGSRKGLFILLFGVLLILLFKQIQKDKSFLLLLFKLVLALIILSLIIRLVMQLPSMGKAREHYMGLINYLIENGDQVDESTRVRGNMVIIGWEQFLRTPFMGVGLDNGAIINRIYNNYPGYLHNNYIEVLVNGGLIGFFAYYSFFIIVLIKHTKRLSEKNPLVYISIVLLILRLVTDWGRVSYFDYMNIPMYSFWIAVSNKLDLCTDNAKKPERGSKYLRS